MPEDQGSAKKLPAILLVHMKRKIVVYSFQTLFVLTVGEPFMAPVGQYVFAEMWSKSKKCTAGSHEWLPYSWIWAF